MSINITSGIGRSLIRNQVNQVNQVFSDIFDNPPFVSAFNNPILDAFEFFNFDVPGSDKFPLYNIEQTKDLIHLSIAVAGYSKDRLSVEQDDDTIIIKGESGESKEQYEKILAHQITNKPFMRMFRLNCKAEILNVMLQDGILSVHVKLLGHTKDRKTFEIKGG